MCKFFKRFAAVIALVAIVGVSFVGCQKSTDKGND